MTREERKQEQRRQELATGLPRVSWTTVLFGAWLAWWLWNWLLGGLIPARLP